LRISQSRKFADASDDDLAGAPFDLEAARLVYARQHGFAAWDAFVADVRAVARGERTEPFKEAFEALQRQRWDRLPQLIRQHPDVLRVRGTNGNSLLNPAVSLAGRTREPLPSQAWQLLDVFLRSGADINQANDRGWTPLHQAAYSNQVELATRLIDAGAALHLEAHGEGGTPLAVDPTVEDAIYHSSPIGWADHFGSRRVHQVLTGADVAHLNPRDSAR